jgi:tRNA(Ile)-lysidine synthase
LPYYSATATEEIGTEAAAREWRYQALTLLAVEQGYSHIVTGHTASDRAETLLYNLIRGSGTDGLQSLSWQRQLDPNVQLVRPLLEVTRMETAAFCRQFNLQIWQDSTNHNLQYARNRIRQELLPYLQAHFNPQAETALSQTAELLRADVAYLEMVVESLEQHLIKREATSIGLNRSRLQAEPLALQRRVIRRFLKQALPSAPTFDHIQKLLALLSAPNRSQTDPFPGGMIAQVDGEWIWLKKLPAQP